MQTAKYISSGRNALADEDLLDEGAVGNNPFPHRTIDTELKLEGNSVSSSSVVIFSDKAAAAICVAAITAAQSTKIAEIRSLKIVYSEVYADETSGCVFIKNKESIPESLVYQWLQLVLSFVPKTVVILGGIRRNFLVTKCSSNSLKYLATSSGNAKALSLPKEIVAFEPGNIVTGDTAAILSHCEVRGIEAVAVLAVRDAALTVSAMRTFEKLIPFLGSQIGSVPLIIEKPSTATYSELVKHDSFLSTTENIYI
jgi:hypothetical protein